MHLRRRTKRFLKKWCTILIFLFLLWILPQLDLSKNPFEKYVIEIPERESYDISAEKIISTLLPQKNEQSSITVNTELHEVSLVRAVDGDTLKVLYLEDLENSDSMAAEWSVRLIGIDTPESVHPDGSKNTSYGDYASEYTKMLLANVDTVYLQFDVENQDQYGRLLCYVWLSPDTSDYNNMLNYILIRDGYAMHKEYPPNISNAEIFTTATLIAREKKSGLWQYEDFAALWEN